MHNLKDLTGGRFGRLNVLRRDGSSPDGQAMWACKCDCGNRATIRGRSLRSGQAQSCGCYKLERISETKTSHGMSKSSEYGIWSSMHTRCSNQNCDAYKDYGGRGIVVCRRWNAFENFFADMGARPSLAHTLERLDTNGNYKPSNCVWATHERQCNNRRSNKTGPGGVSMADAIRGHGSVVSQQTAWARINKGWDFERAVSTPARRLMRSTRKPR